MSKKKKKKFTNLLDTPSKWTLGNTNLEEFAKLYVDGKLSNDDWSRATSSLRVACMRYARKLDKQKKEENNEKDSSC